jgi:hypothetical protein
MLPPRVVCCISSSATAQRLVLWRLPPVPRNVDARSLPNPIPMETRLRTSIGVETGALRDASSELLSITHALAHSVPVAAAPDCPPPDRSRR